MPTLGVGIACDKQIDRTTDVNIQTPFSYLIFALKGPEVNKKLRFS